ncbi:MAG: phosphate ABC transporter ATP-binding protein [Ardenticatenaceae bacterium]|nr:phosphate ABC transporter ATP-binding protein [Ardenticatenaceae bacterium]HBY97108.1 phosphate ABC transporter ATP-binding protein [Chloroflexota bacterium]
MTPKYELRDLTFSYSDHVALRDINLTIPANQIFTVFGPAGSGKSTLLRILNRLVDLAEEGRLEGEVVLDGHNIYAPGTDVIALRRRVGIVFSTPLPLPMSVRENITYGLTLAGIKDWRVQEELVEVSLRQAALWDEVQDRLDDPAASLSGGQAQRLCLARTLALRPEVILLDEPTSALDPISTLKVEQALQELKQNLTVVIAPHSIQQTARLADQAAFLLMGELVESGPGHLLFTSPKDRRTEDYITGRFG